jgi:hypothetical protein
MIEVNYSAPSLKIKKEKEQHFVFDPLRKTWLLLTEEEWVRQNFVQYLIDVLHYPSALIAIEKELELNGLKKRFDVLVYNTAHQPWMLIECKAPEIVVNDKALEQVLRYHISVPVSFLVITNGPTTYGWEKVGGELQLLNHLPGWIP